MIAFKERRNPAPYLQQSSTTRAQTAPPTTLRPESPLSSERSPARSASLPPYPENLQRAWDPPISTNRSITSPKRPKSSKRTTSRRARAKDRVQRIIRVINATYGICRRWQLDFETRSLAYPVYQVNERSFFIPATRSDYRNLCSHIDKTDARSTTIKFLKSAQLPDRSKTISGIAVTMPKVGHEILKSLAILVESEVKDAKWEYQGQQVRISKTGEADRVLVRRDKKWTQQPDESYVIPGSEYPFLVVEAVDSQGDKDLRKKLHGWAQGTKTRCKIIVVLEMEKTTQDDYRVVMSIIKNRKVPCPRPNYPQGFRVESEYECDRVEISSPACQGSFNISPAEVCPEEWELDAVTRARVIHIPLVQFRPSALLAIEEKQAQVARDAQGGPSPYNSDQEEVSTPSSSGSLGSLWYSGSEQDDLTDGDYAP
ncbi:MAG: hypothetical protein Q9208_007929 [Pyrenodesmia sp. 3 TL-2023]